MPTPIPRVLRSSHPGARSHDIDSGVIGSPACVLRRRRSDHGEGRRRWREGPQFRRAADRAWTSAVLRVREGRVIRTCL